MLVCSLQDKLLLNNSPASGELFCFAGIPSILDGEPHRVRCFAVEMKCEDISISHEHGCFEWVDYSTAKERLRYDSNKVALWELDNKIRLNMID